MLKVATVVGISIIISLICGASSFVFLQKNGIITAKPSNNNVYAEIIKPKIGSSIDEVKRTFHTEQAIKVLSQKPTSKATPHPIISIDFDDGWESAYYKAFPIIEKHGFKASEYIISNTIDSKPYMTIRQIKDLKDRGHEIGSHTVSHGFLSKMKAAQIDQELSESKKTIESVIDNPVDVLVTPYCDYNDTVKQIAQKHYQMMRNCSKEVLNTKQNFDPFNLNSKTILVTTKPEEIQNWIDQAKAQNGWLILMYHRIDEKGDYNLTSNQFEAQMNLLSDSGVKVLPLKKAFDEFKGSM